MVWRVCVIILCESGELSEFGVLLVSMVRVGVWGRIFFFFFL